MAGARSRRWLVVAALAAACAGAPPRAPEAMPEVPGLARLVGVYPSRREAPRPALWRRIVGAVVGTSPGAGQEEGLSRPFAVAAEGGGLLLADPDARRVLRIDWRSGRAEPITCRDLPWAAPMAVAAGPAGEAWVADGERVVHVTAAGCTAFGQGALQRAVGVALLGDRVYVVDPPAHAVVAFDAAGREVLRFGGRGEADGELNFPTAIAAAPDGTLLVVDALNFRVVRFAADGTFEGTFGEAGDGPGAFTRPKAVAVDVERVYVSDAERDVVDFYDPAGRYLASVGASGSGLGQMTLPAGVAVAERHLFVADSYNRRVLVYELVGDPG